MLFIFSGSLVNYLASARNVMQYNRYPTIFCVAMELALSIKMIQTNLRMFHTLITRNPDVAARTKASFKLKRRLYFYFSAAFGMEFVLLATFALSYLFELDDIRYVR